MTNATTVSWQPHREPLRATLLRNGVIAVVAGTAITLGWRGRISWPAATLRALWPTLGGHFVELFFLNWLRPRIPSARSIQIAARLAVWFLGGIVIANAMALSTRALTGSLSLRHPAWWLAGLAFIGLELVVHVGLTARGRPSIYNARK
jgi:hypothetical protein